MNKEILNELFTSALALTIFLTISWIQQLLGLDFNLEFATLGAWVLLIVVVVLRRRCE